MVPLGLTIDQIKKTLNAQRVVLPAASEHASTFGSQTYQEPATNSPLSSVSDSFSLVSKGYDHSSQGDGDSDVEITINTQHSPKADDRWVTISLDSWEPHALSTTTWPSLPAKRKSLSDLRSNRRVKRRALSGPYNSSKL